MANATITGKIWEASIAEAVKVQPRVTVVREVTYASGNVGGYDVRFDEPVTGSMGTIENEFFVPANKIQLD